MLLIAAISGSKQQMIFMLLSLNMEYDFSSPSPLVHILI